MYVGNLIKFELALFNNIYKEQSVRSYKRFVSIFLN